MRALPVLGVTVLLLLLLGFEIFLAGRHANLMLAPLVGLCMAGTVAFSFMRLASEGALSRIFALAAMFWLLVLLGMGSLDPATRHDIGVAVF